MKKKLTALIAGALMMVGAASAWALPSDEWGIIHPASITGTPSLSPQNFGYFIWTDDAERTSWHMRWKDNSGGTDIFSGTISLQNNTGSFATYSFEGNDINLSSSAGDSFISLITTGVDGLDFTINQTAPPSYVGFDLLYNFADMNSNNIFIGENKETVYSLGEDQDFVIPAPVPEPGTMMLLGAGFLGMAIYGKRRKNA